MSSPLEQLPEELKQQIYQHLSPQELADLSGTSTTMLLSIWQYLQPQLAQLQQQAQALVAQTQALNTTLPQYFGQQ
jgi:hypothetical protein